MIEEEDEEKKSAIMDDDDFFNEEDYEEEVDMMNGEFTDEEIDEDEDDSNYFGGDDDAFKLVLKKNTSSSLAVEYTVVDGEHITSMREKEAERIAEFLGVMVEEALVLLSAYQYKQEQLLERWVENTQKVLETAGVVIGKEPSWMVIPKDYICQVCCASESNMETLALPCGHRYCVNCFREYIRLKIDDSNYRLECMSLGCKIFMSPALVRRLVDDAEYQKYNRLLNQKYLDDLQYIKWCPAPNCTYAVECHGYQGSLMHVIPTVQCKCGKSFCFNCASDDHQPCVCALVKLWKKKCEDDSETANWISTNTKECPKCHTTIEKNGGCNHMTCKKCRYEFCWVCHGPWAEHGSSWYNCNRYEEKSSEDARDTQNKSRQSLERYLHYYNRYFNHMRSIKLEREFYEKIETSMETMQKTDLSWIEVQFLKEGAKTLLECRNTLMWTYAFAYYLERTLETEIFEGNQRDLELAVENLAGLLEKDIKELSKNKKDLLEYKQNVMDKTSYVSQRRDILLNDALEGVYKDRWQYNTDSLRSLIRAASPTPPPPPITKKTSSSSSSKSDSKKRSK